MVECLLWEQDAAGSSPVASTIVKAATERLLLFYCEQSRLPALGIVAKARPADDEARRKWRSGQSFCAAPRHKETLGTARGNYFARSGKVSKALF